MLENPSIHPKRGVDANYFKQRKKSHFEVRETNKTAKFPDTQETGGKSCFRAISVGQLKDLHKQICVKDFFLFSFCILHIFFLVLYEQMNDTNILPKSLSWLGISNRWASPRAPRPNLTIIFISTYFSRAFLPVSGIFILLEFFFADFFASFFSEFKYRKLYGYVTCLARYCRDRENI